ncbi:MAG: hypothetical protein NHG08_00070 [Candidatus Shikimatogenerans sp. JK-2022]|nr:hypothetical protein [Candidatus Shikimatogenerans bostrichidophilus]
MKLLNDKRLFIIDSFIYIYKYYFYYKKFYKNNSIIYGFINFIINILISKNPTYIIIIFDGRIKKNYKKKFFFNYKKYRKKLNININNYILKIKKLLKLLNIKYIHKNYIEADDIIGSIIKYSEKNGFFNYIYTEDKDYYQLLSNKTFIIKNKKIIQKKNILNIYNLNYIKQYIELICFIGDKSDNIPGIPYIGIKYASYLLKKFNNIKNIYLNINKIQNNIKNKIINYKYLLNIYKKMLTINNTIKFNKKIILYRKKIKINNLIRIFKYINYFFLIKKIKKIKNLFFL